MHTRSFIFLSCLFLATRAIAEIATPIVIGEPVRDVINRFADLNIFSSSRLLSYRVVVQSIPDTSTDAVAQINVLLAPYGLVLEMTNDTTGYVAVTEQSIEDEPAVVSAVPTPIIVSPNVIDEIVVSAPYRLERSARRTLLDKQKLAQIPAIGGDVLRSLKVLPGVVSDGLSARHRFRGGDNNEVLYRLDDIVQIEAFHFSDVQSLFTAVNPNVIESAEVYVNGFPARFGTRLSGVVDLHLIEPEKPIQGAIDINMLASSIDFRGYNKNWSWLVSNRVSVVGQLLKKIQSPSEENLDTPSFNDQLVRLSWDNGRSEFVFGAIRSDETLDVERESTGERGQGTYNYIDVWSRWRHSFANELTMTWQLNRFDAKRARIGTLERGFDAEGDLAAERDFDVSTLTNEWRWPGESNIEYLAGWALSRHSADYTANLDAAYGALGQPVQGALTESRSLSFSNSGPTAHAYFSATKDFDNGIVTTAGVRYDAQRIAEVNASEWSGRLAMDWQFADKWSLDLDIGRYSQQQFLYEVQIDEGRTELDPPQNADQINLGLEWTPVDGVQVRAGAYTRRIHTPWTRFDNLYNRVVLLPELHGDRYLIAADQARVHGAEFAISRTGRHLSWNMSYGYSKSEERVRNQWHRRSWDQPHTFKTGITWTGDKWRIGAFGVARSGWPVTPLVADGSQLPASLNTDRLPRYVSLDFHVKRVFRTRAGQVDVYLDVTNLTNRNNVSGYLYQSDLTRLDSKSLPLVPSLGVTWHWP